MNEIGWKSFHRERDFAIVDKERRREREMAGRMERRKREER